MINFPAMRIVYLLTQSLESPSGLGRFWPMAKEMARLGHTVHIYALHPNFEALTQTQFAQNGVSIEYVAPMHIRKQGSNKSYYSSFELLQIAFKASWQLSKSALRTPSDVIHICKPHPMNSLAGLAAHYLRSRLVFLDCDDYEAGVGNFSSGWQRQGVAYFEHKVPHMVRMVTTNTYFMRSKLIEWGVPENRITYLPNGIDPERFDTVDQERVSTLRHELSLENSRVVAYIGTIGLASHAVDMLMDAFAIVHNTIPDSVLLLVGGGEDLESLQAYGESIGLENAMRWIGKVSPELVPLYYQLADVTVDPIRDDDAARGRSPLKLFESWASGVPFVSADVGDRRRLLGDPPAGLLASSADPDSLASEILTVLTHADLANSLSLRGKQRIEDYYWDRLSKQLNDLYFTFCPEPRHS